MDLDRHLPVNEEIPSPQRGEGQGEGETPRSARGGPAPPYPDPIQQAINAAAAAGRAASAAVAGQPVVVDQAELLRRLAICEACPKFNADDGRCTACGCRMRYKARLATEHCPLQEPKW
jgi:hypothetical protein